jgi:hypothetical protein
MFELLEGFWTGEGTGTGSTTPPAGSGSTAGSSGGSGTNPSCTSPSGMTYSNITATCNPSTNNVTAVTRKNNETIKPAIDALIAEYGAKKLLTDAFVTEYTGLETALSSSAAGKTTLTNFIVEQKAKLEKDTLELEKERDRYKGEFENNMDPLSGHIGGSSLVTLQDWIAFILFVTYMFAAVAVFVYIGYRSGWNKKNMGVSLVAIFIISATLYGSYLKFA